MLIQKPTNPQVSKHKRVRWIFRNYRFMLWFTITCILCLAPIFLLLNNAARILLIFLGVISFGYSVPFFSIKNKKIRLRNIPGIKLFLIAFTWSASVVMLPVLALNDYNEYFFANNIWLMLVKRFLLIAAITIPFDIRDLFDDKQHLLKTIPTIFGEKKTYLLCQFFLLGYLVLLFIFKESLFDPYFIGSLSTILLAAWLIFKSKWQKNEYYYFFYLDGILILQYVLMIFFNFIL